MSDILGPRQRLPEALADRLQQEILKRKLAVGDRMPTEVELAQRFDVSRTVVREAARLLVQRGLVTVKPGRGMTIAHFDGRFIAEQYSLLLRLSNGTFAQLLDFRLVLEVEMSAMAAQQRTEEQLAGMRETNDALRAALGSRADFLAADLTFHELIATASGNPFYPLVIGPINGFLRETYSTGPGYPSEAHHTVTEHDEIADAIAAKDSAWAHAATDRHLRRVAASRDVLLAAPSRLRVRSSRSGTGDDQPFKR